MSQSRDISPNATYLITRRTILQHLLLRPDSRMTQIIFYILAIAARRHGIQLHALCAMSTHVHLVVTDVRGVLPSFLHFFHLYVARCTKVLRNWQDAVWDKQQTSVVRLETQAAIVEKIAYVLANPVAAGLVRHAHEWPGAKVLLSQIGQGVLTAGRPEVYLNRKNRTWIEQASLSVTLPPGVTDAEAFRRQIAAELSRLEVQVHAEMRDQGRRVPAVESLTRVAPDTRVTTPEPLIDRNPTFAVGHGQGDAFLRALEAVRAFRSAYRAALEQWKRGVRNVVFPAGTWWMRVFHGAATASVPAAAAGAVVVV